MTDALMPLDKIPRLEPWWEPGTYEERWIPPTAVAFWVRFTLGLPPLKSVPGLMPK